MIRKAYSGDVVPGQDLRGFLQCPKCFGSIQWQGFDVAGIGGNGGCFQIEGRCACGYVWTAEIIKARICAGARRGCPQ